MPPSDVAHADWSSGVCAAVVPMKSVQKATPDWTPLQLGPLVVSLADPPQPARADVKSIVPRMKRAEK